MKKELYDRLIDALLLRGGAILPQKAQATYDLLEELFAPEEAELACTMPLDLQTANHRHREMKKPSPLTARENAHCWC